MARAEDLIEFFTNGIDSSPMRTIGIEVETHFIELDGAGVFNTPPRLPDVKLALIRLTKMYDWTFDDESMSSLTHKRGSRLMFELGRQNIELATRPCHPQRVSIEVRERLFEVYQAMSSYRLIPYNRPVLPPRYKNEDLLVVPDRRDQTWVTLDGRRSLNLLARSASVQFNVSVSPDEAIEVLNRLNAYRRRWIMRYPQHDNWRRYIRESYARYRQDRYGGPVHFKSIEDYCERLSRHDVVVDDHLERFSEVERLNVPLFLRSVWWHFRLKRYGNTLCIECRPFPRKSDEDIQDQLDEVINVLGLKM